MHSALRRHGPRERQDNKESNKESDGQDNVRSEHESVARPAHAAYAAKEFNSRVRAPDNIIVFDRFLGQRKR